MISKLKLNSNDDTLNNEPYKTIVRLRTSYWVDNRGIHMKKDVNILKRKSNNDYFLEDASMVGAKEVMDIMEDVNKIEDGVYELIFVPTSWDSSYFGDGGVEEWKYIFKKIEWEQ